MRGSTEREIEHAAAMCLLGAAWRVSEACSVLAFHHELPRRRIWVSAFDMDRTEVSHGDWTRCMLAGRCSRTFLTDMDGRLSNSQQPVVGVTHAQAEAYCEHLGGRLPSEAEWERAARAGTTRRFPWGQNFDLALS